MTANKFAVAGIQRAKAMRPKVTRPKSQLGYKYFKPTELKTDVFQKTNKTNEKVSNNKARKAI